jgi:hypothetical protein
VRLLRASKNRYGHGGALGIFAMDSDGLAAVPNPSALFLAETASGSRAASGITVVLEGNRPLVVEAQVGRCSCLGGQGLPWQYEGAWKSGVTGEKGSAGGWVGGWTRRA